jgi:hypothetical protein
MKKKKPVQLSQKRASVSLAALVARPQAEHQIGASLETSGILPNKP